MFLGLLSGVLKMLLKEFIVTLLSFIVLSSFSIFLKSSSPSIITLRLNHSTTVSSFASSSIFSCSPLSKKLYEVCIPYIFTFLVLAAVYSPVLFTIRDTKLFLSKPSSSKVFWSVVLKYVARFPCE